MSAYIGVYGMGVMGQSLALNIAGHGYQVAVCNLEPEVTRAFLENRGADRPGLIPCYSLEAFVQALERPRRVLLMITAGPAVDQVTDQLLPLLDPGDIVIDGGNSFYADTRRREKALGAKGIRFFGMGISGGERGALEGPCMMPGGHRETYRELEALLSAISAKAEDGSPCCTYIGEDGAGHYIKMVHNGIEYADIQLICECYGLMRQVAGFTVQECQAVFEGWNKGRLGSYLIEITGKILKVQDPDTGKPLVDVILDTAGQKGTGMWTSTEGLSMGVAVPTIAQAVFARCLSAQKEERVAASRRFSWEAPPIRDRAAFLQDLEESLYAAKICAYAQGFSLLRAAAKEFGWNLDYASIALIWRGGCIIRARLLDDIAAAFQAEPDCANLMGTAVFGPVLQKAQAAWRRTAALSVQSGAACPALLSAISYFDFSRTADCPASLLQAQRDFFGAHCYRRKDREGVFHTQWE